MVLLGLGTVQSKLRQRQPSWKPLGLTHGRGQKVGGCVRERERPMFIIWASLVAQLVKDPPAMWEAWV